MLLSGRCCSQIFSITAPMRKVLASTKCNQASRQTHYLIGSAFCGKWYEPYTQVKFSLPITMVNFREQKTMLLVNHACARGTPAIFVIFVVSRGLSRKALVLLIGTPMCHFRRFRQKPPCFGGTKARFSKSTVSWTPTIGRRDITEHR